MQKEKFSTGTERGGGLKRKGRENPNEFFSFPEGSAMKSRRSRRSEHMNITLLAVILSNIPGG